MCTSSQAQTTHFGLLAAGVKNANGVKLPFTSCAFAVRNGQKALFSEVQCCFAGNTVLHKGHPKTGVHGIYLQGPEKHFILYEWSDKDHC
eukprot:563744-Rhodomonas_salina.1